MWGEQPLADARPVRDETVSTRDGASDPALLPDVALESALLSHTELRSWIGEQWDGLLVSGASDGRIWLRIPHFHGTRAPSWTDGPPGDTARHMHRAADTASTVAADAVAVSSSNVQSLSAEREVTPSTLIVETESAPSTDSVEPWTLETCDVPTLVFAPADAVDFLRASSRGSSSELRVAESVSYWAKVASLLMELLVRGHFIPTAQMAEAAVVASWQPFVNDESTTSRVARLVANMPPVCRSLDPRSGATEPVRLVETFLWKCIDATVRRCLDGEELAHAVRELDVDGAPPQVRWLAALTRTEPRIRGSADEAASILATVRGWVSRVQPTASERTFRTCFALHPPTNRTSDPWRLVMHLQSTADTSLTIDAADLVPDRDAVEPRLLPGPFEGAWPQLRADIATAARRFPPLSACAAPDGPTNCALTIDEAYLFLRDAAPILESEDFGVWLPQWWREDRPRLRLQLHLDPGEASSLDPATRLSLQSLVSFDWRAALGDEELSVEELTSLAEEKAPLVQVRGRWIEAQPGDLQRAVAFLRKNRTGQMTLFEALRQSYLADDVETGLGIGAVRATGWLEKLLYGTERDAEMEMAPQPAHFRGQLRPYQLRGVNWLGFLGRLGVGCCLADDMGLGKTIQLIALLLAEREPGNEIGPTLLIVPTSLVGNWQRELTRFGPSLRTMVHHGVERLTGQEFVAEVARHDVVISTYALTHRDFEHLAAIQWHRIALDEAQNIKNPAAKQSVAVNALRAVHRVGMTGTPVENRLSELWSLLDFLNPGYLSTAADFRRRFAIPIERHHDPEQSRKLRQLIRPFVLRRLKSDPSIIADLPEKMEMKVYCNLTKEQAALYEAVVGNMLGQIDRAEGIQRRGLILAALIRLKQVCNHPAHFLGDESSLPHRSGKCDRLTDMLEEAVSEGDKSLVFTQFRAMGELLKKLLEETLQREVLFLHGGTPRRQRDALVDRFQFEGDKTPIFLLSLRAGGYGLNLTAAKHVFHFDRWWNPAVEDQATDRAHRVGQDKQVQVHKFLCVGTLEERIDAVIEQKRHLAERIVGSGEEWLTELSTQQLRDLFALSADAVGEE